MPDCKHWQYHLHDEQCNSVASFSEFLPNEDVIAGSRDCPVKNPSVFNLCPNRGETSRMWKAYSNSKLAFYSSTTLSGK